MSQEIPYGSLAFMYIAQHVAAEACSRWLPSLPSLIVPAGLNARRALHNRGYLPWAERIYEAHKDAIEAAYAKSKSALYLWADPERLILAPIEVQGIEIDWETAYPEDPDNPFSPAFAPPVAALPQTSAPPPSEVHQLGMITIRPLEERARYVESKHPQIAAAINAIREKFLAAYPEDVRRKLKKYPRVFNLDSAPPLEVLLAYLPLGDFKDRIHDVLTRRWSDIQAHVAQGETAIAILSEELGDDDFLAARPGPLPEKPHILDLGHIFRVAAGAPVTFEAVIEDHVLRGELVLEQTRFVLLLRKEDPHLRDKLAYIENRYPDSPLLPELRAFAKAPRETISHTVLVVERGPNERYLQTRLIAPVTETEDWRDEIYEPPPRA